jgi:hypothetical protein
MYYRQFYRRFKPSPLAFFSFSFWRTAFPSKNKFVELLFHSVKINYRVSLFLSRAAPFAICRFSSRSSDCSLSTQVLLSLLSLSRCISLCISLYISDYSLVNLTMMILSNDNLLISWFFYSLILGFLSLMV